MANGRWQELLQVAGLQGLIPAWETETGWQELRQDYGLRLPDGRHRLRARLHSAQPQAVLLELDALAGVTVNAGQVWDGAPRYFAGGNSFALDLLAGEFVLDCTVDTTLAANAFSARLCAPDRSPAAGITAWNGALPEAPNPPRAFSPWEYHNALMNAPAALAWHAGRDWATWRAELLARMTELLREPERGPLAPQTVQEGFLEPGLRHQVVHLQSEPGVPVVAHLLLPQTPNGAGVLAIHGHGYVHGETLGLDGGDPAQQRQLAQANYAYAREAARRGYVVVAPELRGFGRRADPMKPPKDACDASFFRALHFGRTLVGQQLCDLRAGLDFLALQPAVNPERLGCLGLSTGGRMTMYLSATEPRIKVAVPSGCLNTFRERLAIASSCGTQFVPDLLSWCDTPEVFGLIAPRPLLLELGASDGTSPELFATEAYARLQAIYATAGAEERLALEVFPGGHRWNGVRAWEWLEEWL